MEASDNKLKPTAAELAAQLMLTDIALIQTLEKALSITAELLPKTRAQRDELAQALFDSRVHSALRAENERLVAENARLQGAIDLLWPPHAEEVAEDAADEPVEATDTAAEAEAGEELTEEEESLVPADEPTPDTDLAVLEESATFPNNPTW